MAAFVFTNAYVEINSVDMSAFCKSVKLEYQAELQDETAFGDTTRTRLGGLKDWTVTADFNQDFGASAVDVTMFSIVGSVVGIKLKPVNTSVGSTNPSYNGSGIVESYPPMGNTVGDLATTTVVIRAAGTLARSTS